MSTPRKRAAKKAAGKTAAKRSAGKTTSSAVSDTETRGDSASETQTAEQLDFDALIDELGDPVDVELPAPVPHTDGNQDLLDVAQLLDVDGVGPVGFAKMTKTITDDLVRTVRGAIEWGRQQMHDDVAVYRGLCLMFVRLCFNVGPLYPDAITAWSESQRKHRCGVDEARRGHAGFFAGGDHGHTVLCLGRGLGLSSDVKRAGMIDLCRLADIEAAWGYKFLGDVSQLNGEVAPRPDSSGPTRRTPSLTDRAWRLRVLRRAARNARANGNHARARRLRDWLDAIAHRSSR